MIETMFVRSGSICVIFLLVAGLLQAEYRTFTNEWGDSIEAELLELKKGGSVIAMRMKDGRELDAQMTAFSVDDRKYIHKWWDGMIAAKQTLQPDVRLRITAKMNRKSSKADYNSWYADDKIKSFFPEVVIDNKDLQKFTGNEVRIVVFAEDKRYTDQILVVSASNVKADFESRSKTTLEGEPFRLRLYEYNSSYSSYSYEYGYEYTGYAITVKNSEGEVTHEKSSKSKYLNPKLFFKCKAGDMFDVNFERKLKAYPNSYFVR